jgi:cytochrome c-550 PedF
MLTFLRFMCMSSALALGATTALAHGDVVPQAVDVSTLKPLGAELLKSNPYRGDKEAIRIGSSAYNQNCARCHGLDAISGGISPDLRNLEVDEETDTYFIQSVLRGKVRNGAVYMPPFEGILQQEAIWAIRAYVDTRRTEMLGGAPAPAVKLSPVEELAKKSGCLSCHATDAKSVGPAYREVARKYANVKGVEAKLLKKIKQGGAGAWGQVPMPPMNAVADEDLKKIVKWIVDGAK